MGDPELTEYIVGLRRGDIVNVVFARETVASQWKVESTHDVDAGNMLRKRKERRVKMSSGGSAVTFCEDGKQWRGAMRIVLPGEAQRMQRVSVAVRSIAEWLGVETWRLGERAYARDVDQLESVAALVAPKESDHG